MKKVAVLTTFMDLPSGYGLVPVVLSQLKMLVENGYTPGFFVVKGFEKHVDAKRVPKGVELKPFVPFMHLFDYEVKEQKPEILKHVGKPYKFLPKKYSSSTAVDIFGPYVVTFVGVKPGELYEKPLMFVMKSRRLADGYRKFFQFMWNNSKG